MRHLANGARWRRTCSGSRHVLVHYGAMSWPVKHGIRDILVPALVPALGRSGQVGAMRTFTHGAAGNFALSHALS